MKLKRLIITAALCVLPVTALVGCQPPAEQPNTSTPAVGTPMAKDQEKNPIALPAGMGGAVIINNTADNMRVVVSDTIATVPPQTSFLFILAPATYTFKIYRNGFTKAIPREETIVAGSSRFVYMMPSGF